MESGIARSRAYFAELAYLAELCAEQIGVFAELILEAQKDACSVFIIGNGGSAATASHFAVDLTKAAAFADRKLRAFALTDSTAQITAWGNDNGFESIFVEQLKAHATGGDIVFAISGSGNSANVLRAVEWARDNGVRVLALAGFDGGHLVRFADEAIVVPASTIQLVEDLHLSICHAIALELRRCLKSEKRGGVGALLLDRDGVVNRRLPEHVRSLGDLDLLPGAVEALRPLGPVGVPVAILTNQAAIGRGLVAAATVDEINERVAETIAADGGPRPVFFVCPHEPSRSCACRKPRPGLFFAADSALGIDLERSVYVGDTLTDAMAALAAGCHPILIGDVVITSALRPFVTKAHSLAHAVRISLERGLGSVPADASGVVTD